MALRKALGFPKIPEDDIYDALNLHELPKADADKFMQDCLIARKEAV